MQYSKTKLHFILKIDWYLDQILLSNLWLEEGMSGKCSGIPPWRASEYMLTYVLLDLYLYLLMLLLCNELWLRVAPQENFVSCLDSTSASLIFITNMFIVIVNSGVNSVSYFLIPGLVVHHDASHILLRTNITTLLQMWSWSLCHL